MRRLLVALLCLTAAPAWAHIGVPIPSAHGTATIDGVKGASEWNAATPRAVFGTGALAGSLLYVMDDDVNIYLGLFVPDATFLPSDAFWCRFDSKHDGIAMVGDDEVNTASGNFFDSHFDGVSWGIQDLRYQGAGAATAVAGGNWFEIAHAINTGDPDDMFVGAGQTIGLCINYSNDGQGFGTDVYPINCTGDGATQNDYVDYTLSSVAAADPHAALAAAHVALSPNPLRRGAELAIDYGVSTTAPEIGIFSVSGHKLAELGPLASESGEHVLHWQGSGALAPGVYFVRARYAGVGIRAKTLIIH